MFHDQRISVVIPCLNEEQGLPKVLSQTPDFVDEVVVVDNGSTDRSAAVARSYGARVVAQPVRGYGSALIAGLQSADGDILVTLDADNNLFMSDVQPILEFFLDGGFDFVNGTRFPLADHCLMPWAVRLSNTLISRLIRRRFGIPVTDSQCGFHAIRKAILPLLDLRSPGMEFSQEAKIKAWTHPSIKAGETTVGYGARTGKRKFKAVLDSVHIIRHAYSIPRTSPVTSEGRFRV